MKYRLVPGHRSRSNTPPDSLPGVQDDKDDRGGTPKGDGQTRGSSPGDSAGWNEPQTLDFPPLQALQDVSNADFDGQGRGGSRDEPPSKRSKM